MRKSDSSGFDYNCKFSLSSFSIINSYLALEHKTVISEELFVMIQENLSLFMNVKKCILAIEGDEFRQISKVHFIIMKLEEYINAIDSSKYS